MKFRTEHRERLVPRTIDGTTHHVPETYSEQVPVMPRDWDAVAVRVAAGVVLALTAVAVLWSTYSIGSLLGGGVGYAAAVVFDASWLTVLILEWLARFNARKRRFPRAAGWLLVLLAAGAIFWNGMLDGSVALAVVGAAVSVVGKLLWLAVFRHIDRPISAADAAWLAAEESRLSTQEAIAGARLRAAAAEERTTLRLLQAERIRGALPEAVHAPSEAVQAPVDAEHDRVVAEVVEALKAWMSGPEQPPAVEAEQPANVPLTVANTDRTLPELGAESISALAREYVQLTADNAVATARILAAIPGANPESVAATVRRERRRLEAKGTPGYL